VSQAASGWYAVHAVFCCEPVEDDGGGERLVNENVYLVSASSFEEALERGEEVAARVGGAGDLLEVDGVSARYRFVGLRSAHRIREDGPLEEGDELCWTRFVVASSAEADAMAEGEDVRVTVLAYPAPDDLLDEA